MRSRNTSASQYVRRYVGIDERTYFTGFGKKKRIVICDTLIEKMTTEETVAVLAHEVGHYKKGHIWKGMLSGMLQNLVMMFILGMILSSDTIAQAAGADNASFYIIAICELASKLIRTSCELLLTYLFHSYIFCTKPSIDLT